MDNYNITGICKDCGAGTLNGATNPQFDFVEEVVVCNSCGGTHVDVASITFTEEMTTDEFSNRYGKAGE